MFPDRAARPFPAPRRFFSPALLGIALLVTLLAAVVSDLVARAIAGTLFR